jgi:pyrroloquinoline quinone (PQQ) biosynthesis protein C
MQPLSTLTAASEETLLQAVGPLQARLRNHPLYHSIRSLHALHLFMESHVYAVWDFMSLLKTLQATLTCIEVPWHPTSDPLSRRLINEIVLGEESDHYQGEALSHFELYLRAMQSCGAHTGAIADSLDQLKSGAPLGAALGCAPAEAAAFVQATFSVIATREPHRIAAAFTFGREDLIPGMFAEFVRSLDAELPGRNAPFLYYLERHIELDGEDHGPMALAMMRQLCPGPVQWEQATLSAIASLEARLAFWDAIHARILAA